MSIINWVRLQKRKEFFPQFTQLHWNVFSSTKGFDIFGTLIRLQKRMKKKQFTFDFEMHQHVVLGLRILLIVPTSAFLYFYALIYELGHYKIVLVLLSDQVVAKQLLEDIFEESYTTWRIKKSTLQKARCFIIRAYSSKAFFS